MEGRARRKLHRSLPYLYPLRTNECSRFDHEDLLLKRRRVFLLESLPQILWPLGALIIQMEYRLGPSGEMELEPKMLELFDLLG